MKNINKMPAKLLSLFLALLFVVMSIPFAFAAEPITLTEANVVTWPTIEGEIYFGQKLSDGFTLSGGLVTSTGDENGSAITGKFEFIDPNYVPTSTSGIAALKFIPENTIEYQGFDVEYAWDVLYSVKTITPVLADPNSPPVATPVEEAGNRLSTSTISGGAVKNPYTGELLAGEWYWTNRRTKVEEGGYYPAELSVGVGYDVISMDIYVGIVGDAVETTITEKPTIPEIIYTPGLKWQDISLVGGKAVALGTETEVAGTFSHSLRGDVTAGTQTIDVTFTPNDITTAKSSTCQITVTINKAPIRFVDENGEDIVPEITVPYGTKFNDISRLLKPYVKGPDYTYFVIGDLGKEQCEEGIYTFKATAPSDGANYEDTDLTFKIVIEKKKLNPKLYSATGKLYINDNSAVYHPTGTFTLEYTIDGVKQTPITGIKYNTHFDWNPTKSGDYEYTVIYNEAAEKEYFIIDDFTTNSTIALTWGFKATGSVEGTTYKYGSEVALEAPATDPAKEDKPFYGFVKWEDANGNTGLTEEELSNREISFTMPDGDVELNAIYKFDFCLCIRYYIQIVVDWFNSFFQSIGTLF